MADQLELEAIEQSCDFKTAAVLCPECGIKNEITFSYLRSKLRRHIMNSF